MDTKKKFYIVSFGDSEKYRLETDEIAEKALEPIVEGLKNYMSGKFPGRDFSYYTTPDVKEINRMDKSEYQSYPVLDTVAVAKIRKVIDNGMKDKESLCELNSNAPFDDLN